MSWAPPYPVVKLPDCQQNWDSLRKKVASIDTDLATGQIIDTQIMLGANNGYVAFGNGTNLTSNAAQTTLLQISFTPEVDCWWEVSINNGLIQKLDAAWNYVQVVNRLNTPDADGKQILYTTTASHNALPFVSLQSTALWKLTAGTAYQAYGNYAVPGGSWQYYQGPDYLQIHGKAWAR